jgi:hypothetical protein
MTSSDSSSSSVEHHRRVSDPLALLDTPDLSHKDVKSSVPSLLELTAQLAGKSCTCEMLEYSNPPLDEALLRKVKLYMGVSVGTMVSHRYSVSSVHRYFRLRSTCYYYLMK